MSCIGLNLCFLTTMRKPRSYKDVCFFFVSHFPKIQVEPVFTGWTCVQDKPAFRMNLRSVWICVQYELVFKMNLCSGWAYVQDAPMFRISQCLSPPLIQVKTVTRPMLCSGQTWVKVEFVCLYEIGFKMSTCVGLAFMLILCEKWIFV